MSTPCMIVHIPGPTGPAGAGGANGADGVNAFTTTTLQFTMPNKGANETVAVGTSAWMAVGQKVFIGDPAGAAKGTFQVVSLGTGTCVLKNLEDVATSAYLENSEPGTVFPIASKVSPAGLQGPAGAAGASGAPDDATYLVQTIDGDLSAEIPLDTESTGLMHLTNGTGFDGTVPVGVANDNVVTVDQVAGMTAGQAVFATAAGIESKTAANARSSLGVLGMGTQAENAVAITGGTITGVTLNTLVADLAISDGGTAASTAADARVNLGRLQPRYGILGYATVNLDHGGGAVPWDQTITMYATRCIIRRVIMEAATVDLTATAFRCGLYTAAGAGGNAIVTSGFDPSALTAPTKWIDATLAGYVSTDVITPAGAVLYFYVTVVHAVAGHTMNVWIEGEDLS